MLESLSPSPASLPAASTRPVGDAAPAEAAAPSTDDGPKSHAAVGGLDAVELSPAGLEALRAERARAVAGGESDGPGGPELTDEEEAKVRELSARDREVRAHEAAHKAAAGSAAKGGPKFEYEDGPDGRRYAVGGEVPISLEEGRTPEETVENARRVQRAALAPARPSAQDRAVAAEASQLAARASAEAANASGSDEEQPGAGGGSLLGDLFA